MSNPRMEPESCSYFLCNESSSHGEVDLGWRHTPLALLLHCPFSAAQFLVAEGLSTGATASLKGKGKK